METLCDVTQNLENMCNIHVLDHTKTISIVCPYAYHVAALIFIFKVDLFVYKQINFADTT